MIVYPALMRQIGREWRTLSPIHPTSYSGVHEP
jgi:hypothetical protein